MNHFYRNIPGWFSFIAIYEQAVRDAADKAHFVEVGSWKGRSAAFMAVEIINSGKKIRFDCVDTWQGSPNSEKHMADPAVIHGRLFDEFLKNIAPVRTRLVMNVYQSESVKAAERFYADDSLDFVFIDANHDYENAKADIAAWWPKVKPGGTMAGDDFRWKGVNKAVLEAFPEVETVWPAGGKGCHWRMRK